MAEVGQRLCGGVCRLSAVRSSQGRPVNTGGDYCSVLDTGVSAVSPVRDRHEDTLTVNSPGRSERPPEEVVLLSTPSDLLSLYSSGCVDTKKTPVPKKWAPGMTIRTRRHVCTSPASLRSPLHLRSVCMVILVERPSCGWSRLKVNPPSHTASRNYSWSSEEAPLLHRSRTAYYDILKVSPTATQSQIKTAYYKQSFIYHPDKNQSSTEATLRFSEISEAYTVLGNISLRRKYDQGILSQYDVHSAGRPPFKQTSSRSKGPPHQQQKARRFTQPGGKPIFDFDAFYQAHYGEQLQRERAMRARKQQMEEMQKKKQHRWNEQRMMECALTLAVVMGGLIFVSLGRT